jgi:ribulose-phosphate 3-epimerase
VAFDVPKADNLRMLSLAQPPHLPLIAPSVLGADFANLERECRTVLEAGAELLHLDVMDGHFVPNLTMGPDLCRGLRRAFPNTCLDVHLMVSNPAMFVEPFAKAGANHFCFHVEAVKPGEVGPLIETIRSKGMEAGLAINGPTAVEAILPFIGSPDLVLVMSIAAGFAGQTFQYHQLEKVRAIRRGLTSRQRLQMDGGIGPTNARACREAGCDVLVAASALFGQPVEARAGVISALRAG